MRVQRSRSRGVMGRNAGAKSSPFAVDAADPTILSTGISWIPPYERPSAPAASSTSWIDASRLARRVSAAPSALLKALKRAASKSSRARIVSKRDDQKSAASLSASKRWIERVSRPSCAVSPGATFMRGSTRAVTWSLPTCPYRYWSEPRRSTTSTFICRLLPSALWRSVNASGLKPSVPLPAGTDFGSLASKPEALAVLSLVVTGTKFMAGFIGTPTMNFVPVTTSDSTAKASGFEAKLPKSVPAGKGTLGFRPEARTDRQSEDGSNLQMKVDVVERLGSDQYLYGQVGSDQVTARVDPRMKVAPGDTAQLGLDTRSIHLFDAESEAALF